MTDEPASTTDAPPERDTANVRHRLPRLAAKVSYGLSLTMLATPLVLALFSANSGGPQLARARPDIASQVASSGHLMTDAVGGMEVRTRSVPIIEVRSRRETPQQEAAPKVPVSKQTRGAVVSPPEAAPTASDPPPAAAPAQPTTATQPEQVGPPAPPPWTEAEVSTALKACLKTLAPLGVELDVQAPIRDSICGLPAPVSIRRIGPDHVEFQPPILVNCPLAASLHDWLIKVAQPAARETFGSPIVKLTGTSGYACRNRNGAATGPISEHAFGNAVDVSGVVLADGKSVGVQKDWGPIRQASKAPPPPAVASATPTTKRNTKKEAAALDQARSALGGPATSEAAAKEAATEPSKETVFLKRLHDGACGIFGTVLGPDANEAHHDHLHFDLKGRKRTGICE